METADIIGLKMALTKKERALVDNNYPGPDAVGERRPRRERHTLPARRMNNISITKERVLVNIYDTYQKAMAGN